jgi:hypothetical protein
MKLIWATVALLTLSLGAQAGIIFISGSPAAVNGNETTQWVQTGGFNIPGGANVVGGGVYIGFTQSIGSWDGTFDYTIFADSAGSPGSSLASGAAQNVTVTDTGTPWSYGNNYLFTFDFLSPFAAGAGTPYWLGIHLSSNFNRDEIYWTSDTSGISWESDGGTFNNWYNNGNNRVFFLSDTSAGSTIPEPSTVALIGVGLLGLGYARRRASQR